jgi:hypothetical protein
MHTLALAIIAFTILVLITWIVDKMEKYNHQPEAYPIKYPIEPMSENYFDVLEEIQSCGDQIDLNRAYVRIIIFSGCYDDSASFVHELWSHFEDKQAELKIIS